jgi:Rod binding domain-containing protein
VNVSPISSSAAAAPTTFNAASLRNATPEAQRSAVAKQFEAVLIRQLLGKTMSSMLGGKEGGVAGSVYGDMLTDTMANQLSSGPGLGLGRFIERQLTPRGEAAPTAPATIAPVQPQVSS